jgi:pimeloyl-ACP methyl ester carboxylesterase
MVPLGTNGGRANRQWHDHAVQLSAPVDGFRLAYELRGEGDPVVLLHGWPGWRADHEALAERLEAEATVVVPDLRGFGDSEGPADAAPEAYAAGAQGASVVALMAELGLADAVVAGYDVGSGIAQWIARESPGHVRALVIAPPLPGVRERVLTPHAVEEFWYQQFHRLDLADQLVDGDEQAARAYIGHFWEHWSAPDWHPSEALLDELGVRYGAPGAFVRSINWYRSGSGTVARALGQKTPEPEDRLAVPTSVLWPELDPLFPVEWRDRVDEWFSDATVQVLEGIGHFSPLEAPDAFAEAIRARLT